MAQVAWFVNRQELIVEALHEEIEPFVDDATRVVGEIREGFSPWQVSYTSGERPPPYFVPATVSLARPHAALWNAMLESGGLDLLPISFLTEVAEFYIRTERMFDRYARVNGFSQQQVLPRLDSGDGYFYSADQEELRPIFSVYMQEIDALILYAEETIELGRKILSDSMCIPASDQQSGYST